MELMTDEALVVTAEVEIRALTVRGKQVTLAVFRQLIEEPIIAADGGLVGTPWGTVNYHPDKSCRGKWGHLHIVWQKGDRLRRSAVAPPPARYGSKLLDDAFQALVDDAATRGVHPSTGRIGSQDVRLDGGLEAVVTLRGWSQGVSWDVLFDAPEAASLVRQIQDATKATSEQRSRAFATWERLNSLEQLFIAI